MEVIFKMRLKELLARCAEGEARRELRSKDRLFHIQIGKH